MVYPVCSSIVTSPLPALRTERTLGTRLHTGSLDIYDLQCKLLLGVAQGQQCKNVFVYFIVLPRLFYTREVVTRAIKGRQQSPSPPLSLTHDSCLCNPTHNSFPASIQDGVHGSSSEFRNANKVLQVNSCLQMISFSYLFIFYLTSLTFIRFLSLVFSVCVANVVF